MRTWSLPMKATGIGVFVFLGSGAHGSACRGGAANSRRRCRCIEAHGGLVRAGQGERGSWQRPAAGCPHGDGQRHLANEAVIGAIHPHKLGDGARSDPEVRSGGGHADDRGGVHHHTCALDACRALRPRRRAR